MRRGLVACVVATGIALGAGACSTLDKATSVAIVNGQQITVSEVAEATKQYNQYVATPTGKTPLTEARTADELVLASFITSYAESTGKWKPDVAYNNLLGTIPGVSASTIQLVKFDAITTILTQPDVDAILAVMARSKVEVDPRYGTFDATNGGFKERDLNWMKPVPTDQNPEPGAPAQ